MSFLSNLLQRARRRPARNLVAINTGTARTANYGILTPTYNALEPNQNDPYWHRASDAAPDAVASPEARRQLRNQARLEVANNSYAAGILLTLANDTVGVGPQLQIVPNDRREITAANETEEVWKSWFEETRLAEKLRTSKLAKTQDGETFGLLQTNAGLEHPVKLDWALYEADYFQTPYDLRFAAEPSDNPPYDGIEFDRYGNPAFYWRTRNHPGAALPFFLTSQDFVRIPARFVQHLYRVDRPGQHRGVSEIQSVLNLFADLREYADASLRAADQAARITAVMTSEMPVGDADEMEGGPQQIIDIPKGGILNMPDGWSVSQLRAEQPVQTFREFANTILREIARCLNMPFSIAAGDSSEMNYASGRLDHQTYYRSVDVERRYYERYCLEPIWAAWLAEAQLAGVVPTLSAGYRKRWHWPRRPHVDPQKEAAAAVALFDAGLLDEVRYWSESFGLAIDDAYDQLALQLEQRTTRGLPLPQRIVTHDAQTSGQTQPTGEETDGEE